MRLLRTNHGRARQVIGAFRAQGLLFLLLLVLNGWLIGEAPDEQQLPADDWRQLLLLGYYAAAFLSVLLHITSLVLFIRWLRRAYWNLQELGRPLESSDGWVAGAWFVPVLNLIRPYTLVREVWCQTQLVAYHRARPHTLVRCWWMVFLLQLFAANITSRLLPDGDGTSAQVRDAAWAGLIDSALGVATALLTVRMVQRISADEGQVALLRQVEALGGHPPLPASALLDDQEDY